MSKLIYNINWYTNFSADRIAVSANTKDSYISIGIKDSTVERAAWYELSSKEQINLVTAILQNLKDNNIIQ